MVSRALIFSGVSLVFTGFYVSRLGKSGSGIGPQSRHWESLRQGFSRKLSFIDERFGPREITEDEFVREVDVEPSMVESFLRGKDFIRNPLSRVKTLDGDSEYGSWVRRESALDERQIHVMLFSSDDGTEIYAHEEYSSMHPFYAYEHFNGIEQRREEGAEIARDIIEDLV